MDAFVIRSPVPLPQPIASVARVTTPSSTKKSPAKPEDLSCVFCGRETDNEDIYGKKLYYSGGYTHYFCMLFASGLMQQGPENKGCCGFMPYHLNKELKRGKNIICVFCEKGGATIGCCNKKCKNQWHFPCGLENGALNQYFDNFNSYCEEHRPRQILNFIGELDRICTICIDEVHGDVDANDVLRPPCCGKNTLYHRSCIQRYALSSALHHFKCPLCNNVKEFQKEMQKLGIYIPDQDAAWELEPNAYHELLERYSSCDYDKCKCPEGRNYSNKRSKLWAIALCDVCGSSGIHLKCAGLKSANNEWICPGCAVICPPSPEVTKKKKTDLLSYEEWCESRLGRKRPAAFEHDTPSKRRKRDIADYRTPRYVEVSLCITGQCEGVAARMLQVKPKRQYKKGVVRSLNLSGTDYPDYPQFGDLDSDSESESDIFPLDFTIYVKNVAVDFSRKPERKQINGDTGDTAKCDLETDPLKAYQEYKNSHRKLAARAITESSSLSDTLSVGCEVEAGPVANVSYAYQSRPTTSGANKPSSSKAKPEEFEVVCISDDDDEEPFLDLTSIPDEAPDKSKAPALPLVCDLTEDGKYEIFINSAVGGQAPARMPGSIGPERKVQEWLEAGQGEPNRNAQNSGFVRRNVLQSGPHGQVTQPNSVLPGNKVRADVPVAKVLPMAQSTAGNSTPSHTNPNHHPLCTCHLGRANVPKTTALIRQQQIKPSTIQPQSSAVANVQQHPKPLVDDSVIVLD